MFDLLYSKKPFWTTKTSVSKTDKIDIFPKGLVHGFGQKFEILLMFRFMQKYTEKRYLVTFSLENKPI